MSREKRKKQRKARTEAEREDVLKPSPDGPRIRICLGGKSRRGDEADATFSAEGLVPQVKSVTLH